MYTLLDSNSLFPRDSRTRRTALQRAHASSINCSLHRVLTTEGAP